MKRILHAISCLFQLVFIKAIPILIHHGSSVTNNSWIYYGNFSQDGSALKCIFDCRVQQHTNCYNSYQSGEWRDERGRPVPEGSNATSCLYVTRENGIVNLNHKDDSNCTPPSSGVWRCDVYNSSIEMETLFIYIANNTQHGILNSSSVEVFFTLLTDLRADPPVFSITYHTYGGPVTRIHWTENHTPLPGLDGNEYVSQYVVDTSKNCVYENVLYVRGRRKVTYFYFLSSDVRRFLPKSQRIFSKGDITTKVAGRPTNFSADISWSNSTNVNINVSWKSPDDHVTGYVIYYQSEGGPVINDSVSGGETETHSLDGLQRGLTYNISIVALSEHLPSPLVGPITISIFTTPSSTLRSETPTNIQVPSTPDHPSVTPSYLILSASNMATTYSVNHIVGHTTSKYFSTNSVLISSFKILSTSISFNFLNHITLTAVKMSISTTVFNISQSKTRSFSSSHKSQLATFETTTTSIFLTSPQIITLSPYITSKVAIEGSSSTPQLTGSQNINILLHTTIHETHRPSITSDTTVFFNSEHTNTGLPLSTPMKNSVSTTGVTIEGEEAHLCVCWSLLISVTVGGLMTLIIIIQSVIIIIMFCRKRTGIRTKSDLSDVKTNDNTAYGVVTVREEPEYEIIPLRRRN